MIESHGDESADELEVVQMVGIDVRCRIDLGIKNGKFKVQDLHRLLGLYFMVLLHTLNVKFKYFKSLKGAAF